MAKITNIEEARLRSLLKQAGITLETAEFSAECRTCLGELEQAYVRFVRAVVTFADTHDEADVEQMRRQLNSLRTALARCDMLAHDKAKAAAADKLHNKLEQRLLAFMVERAELFMLEWDGNIIALQDGIPTVLDISLIPPWLASREQ